MRNYIVASWNDADQYDYSGEQIGNRLSKSQKVHFNADGSACVASYADPEVKATKVSIKDRILPQFKRLQTLRTQMIDLEKEYKTTDMPCEEYSILRDVIVCKIERAEVLYKKAINVHPKSSETDEDSVEFSYETLSTASDNNGHGESYSSPVGVGFIDELSNENSFKSFLQIACKVGRKAVQLSQAARNYYNELKVV